jgi:hypothetical protein
MAAACSTGRQCGGARIEALSIDLDFPGAGSVEFSEHS